MSTYSAPCQLRHLAPNVWFTRLVPQREVNSDALADGGQSTYVGAANAIAQAAAANALDDMREMSDFDLRYNVCQ